MVLSATCWCLPFLWIGLWKLSLHQCFLHTFRTTTRTLMLSLPPTFLARRLTFPHTDTDTVPNVPLLLLLLDLVQSLSTWCCYLVTFYPNACPLFVSLLVTWSGMNWSKVASPESEEFFLCSAVLQTEKGVYVLVRDELKKNCQSWIRNEEKLPVLNQTQRNSSSVLLCRN